MAMTLAAMLATAALFLGMLLLHALGRRLGGRALLRNPDALKGSSATEGAVFALLGLVVAFNFSGAGARFEARRALITEEANDIGTAYLRVDLLAPAAQPAMRQDFRRYAELRAVPPDLSDPGAASVWYARTAALQQRIWQQAYPASQRADSAPQATMLLLPALNAMIDITTTRQTATRNHPPIAIFILLGALSLTGSLLVGYGSAGNKARAWFHPVAFAAVISLAIYLIIDLEFPRAGLIQVSDSDRVLVDVRASMH